MYEEEGGEGRGRGGGGGERFEANDGFVAVFWREEEGVRGFGEGEEEKRKGKKPLKTSQRPTTTPVILYVDCFIFSEKGGGEGKGEEGRGQQGVREAVF